MSNELHPGLTLVSIEILLNLNENVTPTLGAGHGYFYGDEVDPRLKFDGDLMPAFACALRSKCLHDLGILVRDQSNKT